MHSNIKHMNYKHWKMVLSQQWTFKPQNFDHFNVIIMIKKTNNGEKKSEIPLRYDNNK